ncbi:hypothetical protein AB6A40_005095 [Gnathostoma spinigerum]|uniref:RING-type domain-containing protein n=1 Tax=Gnathostoma spinigerum TaxID=75299 RepID=A0ABD6ELT3_9BILA
MSDAPINGIPITLNSISDSTTVPIGVVGTSRKRPAAQPLTDVPSVSRRRRGSTNAEASAFRRMSCPFYRNGTVEDSRDVTQHRPLTYGMEDSLSGAPGSLLFVGCHQNVIRYHQQLPSTPSTSTSNDMANPGLDMSDIYTHGFSDYGQYQAGNREQVYPGMNMNSLQPSNVPVVPLVASATSGTIPVSSNFVQRMPIPYLTFPPIYTQDQQYGSQQRRSSTNAQRYPDLYTNEYFDEALSRQLPMAASISGVWPSEMPHPPAFYSGHSESEQPGTLPARAYHADPAFYIPSQQPSSVYPLRSSNTSSGSRIPPSRFEQFVNRVRQAQRRGGLDSHLFLQTYERLVAAVRPSTVSDFLDQQSPYLQRPSAQSQLDGAVAIPNFSGEWSSARTPSASTPPYIPPESLTTIPDSDVTLRSWEAAFVHLIDRMGPSMNFLRLVQKGLTRAEIEQLKSFRVRDPALIPEKLCVICQYEFERRDHIRVLPCDHHYHAKCVDKWLKTNRTCPICRRDASDQKVVSMSTSNDSNLVYTASGNVGLATPDDVIPFSLSVSDIASHDSPVQLPPSDGDDHNSGIPEIGAAWLS